MYQTSPAYKSVLVFAVQVSCLKLEPLFSGVEYNYWNFHLHVLGQQTTTYFLPLQPRYVVQEQNICIWPITGTADPFKT